MTFYMFRGLPGSGKSTRAKELSLSVGAQIVERDEIRYQLGIHENWSPEGEDKVTVIQKNMFVDVMEKGIPIISSDTNYNPKTVAMIENFCKQFGYTLSVIDCMKEVTVMECIRRDALRSGWKHVGETVIREMALRYGVVDKLPQYDPKKNPIRLLLMLMVRLLRW